MNSIGQETVLMYSILVNLIISNYYLSETKYLTKLPTIFSATALKDVKGLIKIKVAAFL
jgi:hypothetical protein